MDRLDCDRMFLAVFETGGFSRAAKKLATSAGQASKLVTRLENELGVQLFHRTTRALSPTEIGRAYYERLKGLIEEFDALESSVRSASGRAAGRIALTVPMSFGSTQLGPALVAFAEAYPEIQLDVSFSDRLANLVDEGFDAAVRIGEPEDFEPDRAKAVPDARHRLRRDVLFDAARLSRRARGARRPRLHHRHQFPRSRRVALPHARGRAGSRRRARAAALFQSRKSASPPRSPGSASRGCRVSSPARASPAAS